MEKFYSLKYDRVFKSIMANEHNFQYLNLILSDIFNREIEIIKFIPTELPVKHKDMKVDVLDIIVKTKDGLIIDLEINTKFDAFEKEKSLSYYSNLYSQCILRGKKEYENIIQVNLNFQNNNNKDDYYYVMDNNQNKLSNNFQILSVNIEKYKKDWYDENIKGNPKHIYLVMLGANKEELEELSKVNDIVKEVKDKVFALNKEEVFIRTMSREDEIKMVSEARGEKRGLAKGEKIGEKRGLAQGEIIGEARGELNKTKQFVMKMLKENLPFSLIKKITNLSDDEIKNFEEDNDKKS